MRKCREFLLDLFAKFANSRHSRSKVEKDSDAP